MKVILLDGNKITSIRDLHEIFKESLDMPEWYGKNLDALHDLLTCYQDGVGIIAVNTPELSKTLGKRWHPFLRLMEDVCAAKDNIRFVMPFEN